MLHPGRYYSTGLDRTYELLSAPVRACKRRPGTDAADTFSKRVAEKQVEVEYTIGTLFPGYPTVLYEDCFQRQFARQIAYELTELHLNPCMKHRGTVHRCLKRQQSNIAGDPIRSTWPGMELTFFFCLQVCDRANALEDIHRYAHLAFRSDVASHADCTTKAGFCFPCNTKDRGAGKPVQCTSEVTR